MGKTFQMVAFLSAICNDTAHDANVLVLCRNAGKLLHWRYQCSVLLPKVKTIIADDKQINADVESQSTASCIILSSMDNALAHLSELKKINYRFVIVHDEQLEIGFDELVKLRTVIGDDSRKVIVCSADMLVSQPREATYIGAIRVIRAIQFEFRSFVGKHTIRLSNVEILRSSLATVHQRVEAIFEFQRIQ